MIDPCSLEPKRLLTVEEALASIKSAVQPINSAERVALKQALGRVLSEDIIVSPINLPYDRNSAMDGYALSSKDIESNQPFTLRLVWDIMGGQAVPRIAKGGAMRTDFYRGCDARRGGFRGDPRTGQCRLAKTLHSLPNTMPYQNIRQAGEDIKQGGLLCA